MTQRLKSAAKYAVILGATVFLVWFSLRGLTVRGTGDTYTDKWNYLYATWEKADKGWLMLVAGIFMLSQLVRAERWRMLLHSAESKTTFHQSLLALLTGYLVNLVIPRGGEVTRCYSVHQFNKTPVEVSLGTVIVERILDVICLLLIVALAFLVQTEMLLDFVASLPIGQGNGSSKYLTLAYLAGAALVIFAVAYFFVKRNERLKQRMKKIIRGFKEGLLSIGKLRQPGLFIFYSVLIWGLYFIMSYCVMLAFNSTSQLGLGAVLSVFALGSIAMAVPLPGGAGAYHTIVPAGLTFLYQIAPTEAIAFVFVFHAWQTLLMIVSGAAAMISSSFSYRSE